MRRASWGLRPCLGVFLGLFLSLSTLGCGAIKVTRAERSVAIDPCKALTAGDAQAFFRTQEVRSGYFIFQGNVRYCWWESGEVDPSSVNKTLAISIAGRTSTKEAVDKFSDEPVELGETGHFHSIPPRYLNLHVLSEEGAEVRMYLTELGGDHPGLKRDAKSLGGKVLARIGGLFPGSASSLPEAIEPSPDPCSLVTSSEVAQSFGLGGTMPESGSYQTLQGEAAIFGCEWASDNGTSLNKVGIEIGKAPTTLPTRGERLKGVANAAYLAPQEVRSHQFDILSLDSGYSVAALKGEKHLFLYSPKQSHLSDEQLREAIKKIATLAASRL